MEGLRAARHRRRRDRGTAASCRPGPARGVRTAARRVRRDDRRLGLPVYALPRNGFRREWGNEWVSAEPVRPVLRILVSPAAFPLRDATTGLAAPEEFRHVRQHLRAAKRSAAGDDPAARFARIPGWP